MYGHARHCVCRASQSSNCGLTLKAANASSEGLRLDLGRTHFACEYPRQYNWDMLRPSRTVTKNVTTQSRPQTLQVQGVFPGSWQKLTLAQKLPPRLETGTWTELQIAIGKQINTSKEKINKETNELTHQQTSKQACKQASQFNYPNNRNYLSKEQAK